MKSNRLWKRLFIICCSIVLTTVATYAAGQNETAYHDPDNKFELQLPANWQAVNYQDGTGHPRVDIIYRDRSFGLLKISQEQVSNNGDLENLISSEIDQNLRFRPGYVYNSTERFIGQFLRGTLLQFDFTQGGQPKKARNYYLKGDGSTVWVLRFAGKRDIFTPLRHETDAIARSFKPIK